MVMDECAFIHEDAWREGATPGTGRPARPAMFISTPKATTGFGDCGSGALMIPTRVARLAVADVDQPVY